MQSDTAVLISSAMTVGRLASVEGVRTVVQWSSGPVVQWSAKPLPVRT